MLRFRPWMLVTGLCLLYALWVALPDPLALVTLGTQFTDGVPAEAGGTEGYDGQFVYFIARDPLGAPPLLDVPAYRLQRILLPALAVPFPDEWLPWVLLAINLSALAAGTYLMERLLVSQGVSRWYALAYGLTLGTFGAVRLSLTEPLAYALAVGGVWLAYRERPLSSAVVFALAALTKETTLLVAAGVGLWLLLPLTPDFSPTRGEGSHHARNWKRLVTALVFGVVALGPFIGWQVALYLWLGEFGVGSGGALATSFERIPFMGVIRIVTEGGLPVLQASGFGAFFAFMLIFALVVGVFVLVPTVWGLRQIVRDVRVKRVTLATWLLVPTALIMLFVPFSTYREPLGILRFIVGLQIAVLLHAADHRNPRVLRYSLLWIFTIFFVISSDLPGAA